ncbi:MAG: glycosyltransferase family 39 protein [Planctomycetia bacterium]|nr:glycosyltransferase family 39 protein [Planctomycetia bacterium]
MLSRASILALLMLLSLAQQWRLIAHAPLPAQDAVEFVGIAQQIQFDGAAATIRSQPVAPLFPLLLYATHAALTGVGLLDDAAWGRAAQVAAALPLLLAVVPVGLLSWRLVGREAGLLAAILFCVLPASSRLGADGISDSLHLCLAAWSLWALVVASERVGRSACAWSLLSGALVGAALLCRAEALVIAGAVALATVPVLGARWRYSAAFACGCLVCLVPYVASGVTGATEIAERLRGGATASSERPLNRNSVSDDRISSETESAEAAPLYQDEKPLLFGRKDRSRSIRLQNIWAVTLAYCGEFLQAGGYFVLPLAVIGIGALRHRKLHPSFSLLGLFTAIFCLVAFIFAARQGYIASRHFLLPVLAMLPYASAGLVAIGQQLRTRFFADSDTRGIARGLTTALAGACVLVTLRPLHGTHTAHRRAADWLRSSAAVEGTVLDQHGWTALFTGRPTYRFDAAEKALVDRQLRYVLVDRIDLEAESRRGESLRAVLGSADRADVCFPDARGRCDHDVLLFHRTAQDNDEVRLASDHARFRLTAHREMSHAR